MGDSNPAVYINFHNFGYDNRCVGSVAITIHLCKY